VRNGIRLRELTRLCENVGMVWRIHLPAHTAKAATKIEASIGWDTQEVEGAGIGWSRLAQSEKKGPPPVLGGRGLSF
jgi:hypothetical protein